MKMLPGGEGVKATLLASRVALTPSPPALSVCPQLLSVVRPLCRSGRRLSPRGRPSLHRFHRATAEDWSAHRAPASAAAALDSALPSLVDADRASGLHPICAAPCPHPLFFRADASPAGTSCSTPTSAHRARCLLRSALEYPGAVRQNTAAPGCRFSALRGGYHSSGTGGSARAAPLSLSLSRTVPDAH